ncbi:hypothetical protein [Microbulbifer sp. SAOS-129_SWC]|uniref:hypothetical protein n=1 Tax=Microbulbifer sp. SAOS-129_SWC TaxID=3145235 RepID=UPI003217D404
MRQFSILVIFVVAFGSAAALYEHESRKVRGVLSQITELQAQMGDLRAEVNRLNSELEAAKLAQRRKPSLNRMASHLNRNSQPATVREQGRVRERVENSELIATDVTSAPPAIHGQGDSQEDGEWAQPTVDSDRYREETEGEKPQVVDPYQ